MTPRGPVPNMTEVVESAGGIIVQARFAKNLLDGLSFQSEGMALLFFMNSNAQRSFSFSLAHELGHMVMHGTPDNDEKMGSEAHRFAAAFS
jgi:Zn-dependent peptidase ImmA (M78 family)